MNTLKGRLRRNASNVAMVVVMLAAGTILYVQALATSQLQKQVAQQQQIIQQVKDLSVQLNDRATERTTQIDQLNRHLDCIVVFFSRPYREQESISDIDTCTVQNSATGVTYHPNGILVTPTTKQTSSSSSTQPPTSPQTTTSSPAPVLPALPQVTVSPQTTSKQNFFQRDIEQPIRRFFNVIF